MWKFLGHAGFYRRFIQDFSKISKPLYKLLEKDAKFEWDAECQQRFEELKAYLTTTSIVRAHWQLAFEVMCNASDLAVGAVLGQRAEGKPYVVYYASKTLNEAQRNYTTTEKELLSVVYALDKFRAYLIGADIIIFTDHSAGNICSLSKMPRLGLSDGSSYYRSSTCRFGIRRVWKILLLIIFLD